MTLGRMVTPITVPLRVRWGDCDPAGIVFYPRFFEWMDMCSHDLHRLVGIDRRGELGTAMKRGLPLVEVQAEFLSPAVVDDEIEIRAWVVEVRRTSLRLRYELVRPSDGVLVARAAERRVHVVRDPSGRMIATELTPEMRVALEPHTEARAP